MIPDWKDPWPEDDTAHDQRPDDDQNDHDDDGSEDENSNNSSAKPDNDTGKDKNSNSLSDGPDKQNPRFDGNSRGQSFSSERGCNNRSAEGQFQNKLRNQIVSKDQNCRASSLFKSIRNLGYGSFGIVDEVEHSITAAHFARKTIRIKAHDSFPAHIVAQNEVSALRILKHEHIVKVFASWYAEDQFSLIISPIADCNLSQFMDNITLNAVKERSLISKWFGCLASALSYLHGMSWVHLDIKPDNILIAEGDRILISDFGSAYSRGPLGPNDRQDFWCAITPMYCAPEIVTSGGAGAATPASDVFSLGGIYLEMATLIYRVPVRSFLEFRSFNTKDGSYYINIRKSQLWVDSLLDINDRFGLLHQNELQFIGTMLNRDAKKRPSAKNVQESFQHDCAHPKHTPPEENDYFLTAGRDVSDLDDVSKWLKTCLASHSRCSRRDANFFPSRILNVGTNGNLIHLQSSLESLFPPYVALSHCWGECSNVPKTTSQSMKSMSVGINISSLPRTFWDAIQITRALGFRYLWVDSLCILQDSHEDWERESSMMAQVYSSSTLTLAVTSAVTGAEQPLRSTNNGMDSGIQLLSEGDVSHCSVCPNSYRTFEPLLRNSTSTILLESPLTQRAWTLQERLLSPRVLHFTNTQLFWECTSGSSTVDRIGRMRESLGVGHSPKSKLSPVSKGSSLPLRSLAAAAEPRFRDLWRDIVIEYSKRQLTYSSDKLVALAGIAAKIGVAGYPSYLAGLWNNGLKHDILWCRDFSSTPTPRPKWRAPSWSWASIDSPIVWSKSIVDVPGDNIAEIISYHTSPLSKISPFGEVANGSLKIYGLTRIVVVVFPYVESLLERESLKSRPLAQWQPDALEMYQEMTYKQRYKKRPLLELCCLQTLRGVGLVLKKRESEGSCEYERVGVYWMPAGGIDELNRGCWEEQVITIV
jgi:serine/threonine protein kinase